MRICKLEKHTKYTRHDVAFFKRRPNEKGVENQFIDQFFFLLFLVVLNATYTTYSICSSQVWFEIDLLVSLSLDFYPVIRLWEIDLIPECIQAKHRIWGFWFESRFAVVFKAEKKKKSRWIDLGRQIGCKKNARRKNKTGPSLGRKRWTSAKKRASNMQVTRGLISFRLKPWKPFCIIDF